MILRTEKPSVRTLILVDRIAAISIPALLSLRSFMRK